MPSRSPFHELPLFGYDIIYADPPWRFENYSEKGEEKNASRHYQTMEIADIMAMPVGELASPNCACLMWATYPLLPEAIATMRRWGFEYKTVAFTWVKLNKRSPGYFMSTGYYTRANAEICLLGMTGRVERKSRSVRQLIVEPVREHSRKPDRVSDDIVQLFGPRPRIELFARTERPGWDTWGNQTSRFNPPAP